MTEKWVYRFHEIDQIEKYAGVDWEGVRSLLEGKGAIMAKGRRLKIPIIPGAILTTKAYYPCNDLFLANASFEEVGSEFEEPGNDNENDKLISDICLVIMPFGGYFDEYYAQIYQPAIEASGFNPIRADNLFRPGSVLMDIWELIKQSKIILADLTDNNPNVLYELGVAHANSKPVLMLSQNIGKVPFDLRGLRIIEYDVQKVDWSRVLRQRITKAITDTVKCRPDRVKPDSLDVY